MHKRSVRQHVSGRSSSIVVLALCAFAISSCDGPRNVATERSGYESWLADPSNGLIKERRVNGLLVRAQIRPSDLLQSYDAGTDRSISTDAARGTTPSVTLLLTYSVDGDAEHGDVLLRGISSYED